VPETTKAATPAPGALTSIPAEPAEQLVITAGTAIGRRIALSDELVIGRTVTGDGRLSDDREASRRHARIVRDATGQLTIEDLGSANGTLVNGELVRGRRALKVGDSIRIGTTTLRLTAGRDEPLAAPAAPAGPASAPPRPAPAQPRAPVPPEPPPAAPVTVLPLGSVFAGCRIEEVIGHGDMGVVYRAEELALQRPVALKVINAEHSREERFRERFRRESKIAAAIDHQNVIPIFDAGEEQGVMFITMRLVEGTDMRALIAARGHVEPLLAARLVRQVGAALDAAHARGMLHRDVKPSNVLLGRRDHAYLADFGLAKQASAPAGLTRQGSIVARVEYVAPEQILNQPVDARADVYALGCLLFEALTGEEPFARWTDGPHALAPVEAPVPSAVALRPGLPAAFDDVLRQAMAKDPDERYPSAGDLGEAALVAAGGLQRARPLSIVATGEASFVGIKQRGTGPEAAPGEAVPATAEAGRSDARQWAIALAALVLMAVAMAAATVGISSL
jgi:predicted Ser/Thr protein kinase